MLEQIENNCQIYDEFYARCSGVKNEGFDYIFELCGSRIHLGGNLLFCHSNFRKLTAFPGGNIPRGDIKEFSHMSAIRMRRFLRETVCEYGVFITLTYPQGLGGDGPRAKRDLKCFMQRYRRLAERDDIRRFGAFWFLEFQTRGAIHFHVFGTHKVNKEALSRIWYDIVGSEDPRHLAAGTNVQSIRGGRAGICSYASKYASKHVQKCPPKELNWCGRFWGVCGERGRVVADTFINTVSFRTKSIHRRLKELQNTLEDGIFAKKCKRIESNRETLILWSISCPALRAWVSRQINLIQMTVRLYNPISDVLRWPELYKDEDISCR